ncbi:MAG: hypothetical protein K1X44_02740 [Alphaproteobacteria bacterium]|nr:hypothetical protein [Alphaproteobacteria bacterium]
MTTEKYEGKLDAFIGRHVDELVYAWGPPDKSYTFQNGTSIMEYAYDDIDQVGDDTPGSPRQIVHYKCKTKFEIDQNGIIRTWSWLGNDCQSY